MTLHERLRGAAAKRRAAGRPAEGDDAMLAEPLPKLDLTKLAPVIDLRAARRVHRPDDEQDLEPAGEVVARDDRCPACATPGTLDFEDLGRGVDHYSCPNCSTLFRLQR